MSRSRTLHLIALLTALCGCAGPITQTGTVSPDAVRAEQDRQRVLLAETALADQDRVNRLARPLLRAAAPLCAQMNAAARDPYSKHPKVRAADSVCAVEIVVLRRDELNAYADGKQIGVHSSMLRFSSDQELSLVLAHEIAHHALRHVDAMRRNRTTGAIFGAIADIAIAAAGGGNTGGEFTKQGAAAGALAFSQDFEREADYVGLYILAWAGQPIDDVAGFWRRFAAEHPASITFAQTHPTTAERFVRLEQWGREIAAKLATGAPFGPEMRDKRLAVLSRPSASGAPAPVLAASAPHADSSPHHDSPAAPAVRSPSSARPSEVAARSQARSGDAASAASVAGSRAASPDDRFARATIGAPRSEADRASAVPAYEEGTRELGAQRWKNAERAFRRAIQLDGSVATYHAALGEVLLVEEDWAAAAAEYTAALLLDVDNSEYRERLKEARSHRSAPLYAR